eukprot:4728095-Pyramimonas_sp.AAC.1
MGPYASAWLTVCPTTPATTCNNDKLRCAVRRRLGLAVACDGPDPHGFSRFADNEGARLHARHTGMVAAWRQ